MTTIETWFAVGFICCLAFSVWMLFRAADMSQQNEQLRTRMQAWFNHTPEYSRSDVQGKVRQALAESLPTAVEATAKITITGARNEEFWVRFP